MNWIIELDVIISSLVRRTSYDLVLYALWKRVLVRQPKNSDRTRCGSQSVNEEISVFRKVKRNNQREWEDVELRRPVADGDSWFSTKAVEIVSVVSFHLALSRGKILRFSPDGSRWATDYKLLRRQNETERIWWSESDGGVRIETLPR